MRAVAARLALLRKLAAVAATYPSLDVEIDAADAAQEAYQLARITPQPG